MTDLIKLRNELRGLRRSDLLIIAERAAEFVPKARRLSWATMNGDDWIGP